MVKIVDIKGCEVLDFCGNFIVEVDVILDNGIVGSVCVFFGVFIGFCEVFELCDGDKSCYLGKGVLKVVVNINGLICDLLLGKDVVDQKVFDYVMIELDGIENKVKLGVNVIFVVFLVVVKVVVQVKGVLLYVYIVDFNGIFGQYFMLVLMMNIINGGEYVDNNVDIQEFMVQLVGVKNFVEVLCMGVEIFYYFKVVLKVCGLNIVVGDEGGFVLNLLFNEDVLVVIVEVVEKVGYKLGDDVILVLDCVFSEFFKDGKYDLEGEGKVFDVVGFVDYLVGLIQCYLIIFIEDGMDEFDWVGWKGLIDKIGVKV